MATCVINAMRTVLNKMSAHPTEPEPDDIKDPTPLPDDKFLRTQAFYKFFDWYKQYYRTPSGAHKITKGLNIKTINLLLKGHTQKSAAKKLQISQARMCQRISKISEIYELWETGYFNGTSN